MNLKKTIVSFLMFGASLSAAPQTVIFDWGNVIATEDRAVVVDFLCNALQISASEFESVNLEKRKAVQAGKTDVEFWLEYAQKKAISLGKDWPEAYRATLKKSVGADSQMYALIDALKAKQIRVGLLSNINDRYVKLIRSFGFYAPFDPCLLSCEMGLEKPDPRAYEALFKATGLRAEEIVFIDDKQENVEAAKKLGIDAITFISAEQVRQELAKRKLL